ncbi:uncharacterized protein PRD47_013188 [Ara ararauna]
MERTGKEGNPGVEENAREGAVQSRREGRRTARSGSVGGSVGRRLRLRAGRGSGAPRCADRDPRPAGGSGPGSVGNAASGTGQREGVRDARGNREAPSSYRVMKDSNAIVCRKCFEMDPTHHKHSEGLLNSIVPEF